MVDLPNPGQAAEDKHGKRSAVGLKGRYWLVLVLGGTLALGAIFGWAIATVFTPPEDVLDSTDHTLVEVVEGEVGSSISLNTLAQWTPAPAGTNLATGTVTSVNVEPGAQVETGHTLFTVNLRPTVVAQGTTPAFRSLSPGATGADVAQLQVMLQSLGHLASAADGSYGSSTVSAVRTWQKSLGVEMDGTVQAGDIVFVPTLPTRIALDPEVIATGRVVAGGETAILGLPAEPEFVVPVTDAQAAMMPPGTRVEITGPEGQPWIATVAERQSGEDGAASLLLRGMDSESICGELCSEIPITEPSYLTSRVVTVPAVQGLTVPAAALLSKADGTLVVTERSGQDHTVTLVTSARGMAIIEGVEAGMSIRVPAKVE